MLLRTISSLGLVLLLLISKAVIAQRTKITHTTYAVTTASTTALAANVNRNFLILENDSDTIIYCSFNVPAVINQGIRLSPSGGSLLLDYKTVTYTLNCIQGGVGTKGLLITEGVQ